MAKGEARKKPTEPMLMHSRQGNYQVHVANGATVISVPPGSDRVEILFFADRFNAQAEKLLPVEGEEGAYQPTGEIKGTWVREHVTSINMSTDDLRLLSNLIMTVLEPAEDEK